MRLNVRREQIDVMDAVAEANFERRIADHLRQNYANSVVKLPDGGEFTVGTLMADTLERLVGVAIAKARRYQITFESSIASFVALMFDAAPNFDEYRLCEVLLGDEEKQPDERVGEIPKILSEKNWDAIRGDYDPSAWIKPAGSDENAEVGASEKRSNAEPAGKAADPISRTVSGKTFSRTTRRKRETIDIQPEVKDVAPDFDLKTVRIDRKE